MSPIVIAPLATRMPPRTAMATKLRLPMNIVAGCDHARDELGAEAGLVQLVVRLAERLFDVALAPEAP